MPFATVMPSADAATAGAQLSGTVLLVGPVAGLAAAYLAGARRLPAPTGTATWTWPSWTWRRFAFCGGLLVVVLTLLPAVDPVVDASFPLHMAQHMVLMFVAAPLLALGAPGLPLLLALPPPWRRRVTAARASRAVRAARTAASLPAVVLLVNAVVVVGWHFPAVYDAALRSEPVHAGEHACFLLAAWLLWLPLADRLHRMDGGRAVLYVFLSGFPMVGVGAALVLATRPLYPAQTGTGPGALAAQQIAGVVMWIPPSFVSLLLSLVLLLFWLRGLERATPGDAPLPSPIPPVLPDVREAYRPAPTFGEVPR